MMLNFLIISADDLNEIKDNNDTNNPGIILGLMILGMTILEFREKKLLIKPVNKIMRIKRRNDGSPPGPINSLVEGSSIL